MADIRDLPFFRTLAVFLPAVLGLACAGVTKPCTRAGDFSAIPLQSKGDMRCHQKLQADGTYLNHGEFYQFAPGTDTRVLEGYFEDGHPVGVWRRYDLTGKNLGEINFNPPPPSDNSRNSSPNSKR